MADGRRSSSAWIGGVATILIGVAFLWRNQGPVPRIDANRWWAWMLLLPAIMLLTIGWRHWKADGRVGGAFLAGLLIIWVASVFLLSLPFAGAWPLAFIFLGTWLVLRTFGR